MSSIEQIECMDLGNIHGGHLSLGTSTARSLMSGRSQSQSTMMWWKILINHETAQVNRPTTELSSKLGSAA